MTATSHPARPRREPQSWRWIVVVSVVALAFWSVVGLDARWGRLPSAPGDLFTVFRLMVTNLTWDDVRVCVEAMWDSIAIAWVGTLVAAVVAIPLAFVAAENLVPRWAAFAIRQVLNVLRAIPEIILVMAFIPIFGLTKNAGILAIGIGSIGTLGKLCAETIEGIDRGPIEAVDSTGANRLQRLRWAVIPQSMPEIASFILYRFEINIRVSTILGAVGAGGIGQVVDDALTTAVPRNWGLAGLALITVVIATVAIDALSGAVRRRILAGPERTPTTRIADEPGIVAELMS